MKDITIPGKRIRTELRWLLISLAFAFVLNIYSIIKYKTSLVELITSLHIIILMSLIIYVLLIFVRGLAGLLIRFTAGKRKDNE
ncbi:hypothetical protein ACFLSP_00475 [Bacteroidota bacterium]